MFWEVFFIFAKVSLLSFGGIFGMIPEIERILVVNKGWLSSEEFLQFYSLGQFLPGPNMSMCPLIGYKVGGWSGFWGGFLGIYAVPLLLVGALWYFYSSYRKLNVIKRIEKSLRPIVLGLMIASSFRVFLLGSVGIDHAILYIKAVFSIIALVFGALILFLIAKKTRINAFNSIFLFGALWVLAHWIVQVV